MLLENMSIAFSTIRANKMCSFLTILGIIVNISPVISTVSIEDIMGSLSADLYKDVGITQAYISIGYRVDDTRQANYFTLDKTKRVHEMFEDKIACIDCSSYTSTETVSKKVKISSDHRGIDYNHINAQPVDVIYGRYSNEGDILGREKNMVMDVGSVMKLFGTENTVGMIFRTTIYGSTGDYTMVDVYKKEMSAFQKLTTGGSSDKGSVSIPYTILTWSNDYFHQLHVYAKDDVDLDDFFSQLKVYAANLHDRQPEDMYLYTVMQEMTNVDTMMGGLSVAIGGIVTISLLVGGTGIINIMLVSVTERTRGVSIRKVLRARAGGVLIQFLIESAIFSAYGGITGIVIGVGLVSLGSMALRLSAVMKPSVIVLAVTFSAIVGIFFGLYPASKVAKADPIDALRYG